MESIYHIVAIRVNETSWAHVWRLRFRYLGTGYDNGDWSSTDPGFFGGSLWIWGRRWILERPSAAPQRRVKSAAESRTGSWLMAPLSTSFIRHPHQRSSSTTVGRRPGSRVMVPPSVDPQMRWSLQPRNISSVRTASELLSSSTTGTAASRATSNGWSGYHRVAACTNRKQRQDGCVGGCEPSSSDAAGTIAAAKMSRP
jgi:hypothetical protein